LTHADHVIHRYADAWRRGDLASIVACYHDEFTLHYFGRNPLSGDHVGKAASLIALGAISLKTNRKLLEITDVMVGPKRCAVQAREAFNRDGQTVEIDRVLIYTIKDGLLHECWVYDSDQARVDEFLR
jgi:ketosteroid isomerase-like protein